MNSLEGLIIYGVNHDEINPRMQRGQVPLSCQMLDFFHLPGSRLRNADFLKEFERTKKFQFLEDMKMEETHPEYLKSVATRKVKTYMSIIKFYEPYKKGRFITQYGTSKLVQKAIILCMNRPDFKIGRDILNLIHEKVYLSKILKYIKQLGIVQSSPFLEESFDSDQSAASLFLRDQKIQKYTSNDVRMCKQSIEFYLSMLLFLNNEWKNQHNVSLIHQHDLSEPFLHFLSSPPLQHYLTSESHTSLSKLTAPPLWLRQGTVKQLFTQIPIDHILELFQYLIKEQSILLIQTDYAKIGYTMCQLLSLLHPLQFSPHLLRCYLTPQTLYLLKYPSTYFLGISRLFWDCRREENDITSDKIYDIDKKQFIELNANNKKQQEIPNIELPNIDLLRSSIEDILKQKDRWLKQQNCETYEETQELWWVYFSLKIRQAFFNYILLTINNYMDFFEKNPKKDPNREHRPDIEFDIQGYIKEAPKSHTKFLQLLADTTIFQNLLNQSYDIIHRVDKRKEYPTLQKNPYLLSFTRNIVKLKNAKGFEKSGLKAEQDKQIRELIARYRRPTLVSFEQYTKTYCNLIYSRKHFLNQSNFHEISFQKTNSSPQSDVNLDEHMLDQKNYYTESAAYQNDNVFRKLPQYNPIDQIERQKVLEIRAGYEQLLYKSSLLQTSELMRKMAQQKLLRIKEVNKEELRSHKRGMSKNKMQEKYAAAWENFGKDSNKNIMRNKNFLGLVNQKIVEVNQSCELGDSNFLNNRSNNRTMIVDQEQESNLENSLGIIQGAITQQSCCIIEDTDEQEDDLISLYSSTKTKSTYSNNTKHSYDIKSKKSIELRHKSRNSLYSNKNQQSSTSSIASSSSSRSKVGVKKINLSKQNIGIKRIGSSSSSSANNTTAAQTCNNTIITNSTTTSGNTTPLNSTQIITPSQKGYKITISNIDKSKKYPKPPLKYVAATPLVAINLQEQQKKQQMGGVTPLTGTWKDRDATQLVTTQKKVIYSGQEQLNDYQHEVDRLKGYENRFEFIQEEKKNIRFNNTTKTNIMVKRHGNIEEHRRIGRNLFKTSSSCEKSKITTYENNRNQNPCIQNEKGGESPSTVQFAAFKQKQHNSQKNKQAWLDYEEEKQFFKRAQTQISKQDKRFQDYSPYRPELIAQKEILQMKLQQSSKDYQKLLFGKFFPIQCISLVTKKAPMQAMPDSFKFRDFNSSQANKTSINFDQFGKSYPKNVVESVTRVQSNRNIIDTSSPPFQTLPQPSMTSRNEKQNHFRTEISPSCNYTSNSRFTKTGLTANINTPQQFNRNTPHLSSQNQKKAHKMLILSPNNIKPASQTPQIQPFSANCANRERQNITTPKASMGGIKHSMSSMNTPTSRFLHRAAVSSGKVLFNKFTDSQTRDSSQQFVQITNARVHKPIAAINTKLPKSSVQSTSSSNQCKCNGKTCTLCNNNNFAYNRGGGYCTLGASVGSKLNYNNKSAFKSQASRKLSFPSQQRSRQVQTMKSKQNGQNSSLNFNSGSNKKHRKLISQYAKTPFDKASALKRQQFNDSSSGRKMSGIPGGVAAFGGFNGNKFKKLIENNDEVKKELFYDKSSIGSGMR